MGNVYMEANQIRYRGPYRTVQEALDNGGGGGGGSAASVSYDGTSSGLEADNVQGAIDEIVVNFRDGVDDVYDACVAKGSTPTSHTLSDVITAIGNISTGGLSQVNPFGEAQALTLYNANGVTVNSSAIDSDGTLNAQCSEASAGYEGFVIELDVTSGHTYLLEFDLQADAQAQFNNSYRMGFTLENSANTNYQDWGGFPENITRDYAKNHYAGAVHATGSKAYINFNICGFSDATTNVFTISDLKLYDVV